VQPNVDRVVDGEIAAGLDDQRVLLVRRVERREDDLRRRDLDAAGDCAVDGVPSADGLFALPIDLISHVFVAAP
jgi:hypothetical protein